MATTTTGTMSIWQPIETAPKDGTAILVCDVRDYAPVVARFAGSSQYVGSSWYMADFERLEDNGDGILWTEGGAEDVGVPTHWMPLPDPPP